MIIIKDKKECSGCEACINICPVNCIEMKEDEYGLRYPHINKEKCINCGLCERVCPILNKFRGEYSNSKVFGMSNKDNKILKASSSGGVFYELAKAILEKNGIVYGVNSKLDFQEISDIKNLKDILKSKYLQAKNLPYKRIKENLEKEKLVLVSGTPCQIAGLKSFLRKDYINLYTVSFVCENVPSPIAFDIMIKFYENKYKSKVKDVEFRSKKYGWIYSGFNILNFENGKKKELHNPESPFLYLFYSMKSARPSCLDCKFRGLNGASDIILSDFWGVKKSKNSKFNFNGVSQVLFNEKGMLLFKIIKDRFNVFESSIDEMKELSPMFNDLPNKEVDQTMLLELKEKEINEAYKFLMENFAASKIDILKFKLKMWFVQVKYRILGFKK